MEQHGRIATARRQLLLPGGRFNCRRAATALQHFEDARRVLKSEQAVTLGDIARQLNSISRSSM